MGGGDRWFHNMDRRKFADERGEVIPYLPVLNEPCAYRKFNTRCGKENQREWGWFCHCGWLCYYTRGQNVGLG